MPLSRVDKSRCARDGACMAVCPFGIIQADKEGFPRSRRALEGLCIRCGHCVAVCPHRALTTDGIAPEQCEEVGKSLPTGELFARLMKARRSVREFKDEPVERDALERALDVTRWAPTGKNGQPCRWIIVLSREKIRVLAGMAVDWIRAGGIFPGVPEAWDKGVDLVLRNAPCLAVVHAGKDAVIPQADCTIALAHLELAASALGLGACWAGFFMAAAMHHPPIAQALDLPEGDRVYGALLLGRPKHRYPALPPRKPLDVRWV